MAVWSNRMRKEYFPDPVPDSFYTETKPAAATPGCLKINYAWEWGDALFVVLDPFWYTSSRPYSKVMHRLERFISSGPAFKPE